MLLKKRSVEESAGLFGTEIRLEQKFSAMETVSAANDDVSVWGDSSKTLGHWQNKIMSIGLLLHTFLWDQPHRLDNAFKILGDRNVKNTCRSIVATASKESFKRIILISGEPRDDLVRTELGDSCQRTRFHERTISERNFPDGRDSAADGESLKIRAIFLRSMSPVIGIFMERQQSEHALNTTS